jgi:hypothetical protein
MTRRALLTFVVLVPLAQSACSSCGSSGGAPEAGVTTTGVASASAASATPGRATNAPAAAPVVVPPSGAPTGACALDGDPAVVDEKVRTDVGVTGGIAGVGALGWAKAQGAPAAATFDAAGLTSAATVADAFPALDAKPAPGTTRVVQRVVPIAVDGAKVHVAVDWVETTQDKRRHVQCGPPEPFVAFDGPSLTANADGAVRETVDCRTIATEGGFGALESVLERDGAKLTATLRIGGVVVAKRETTLKPGEVPSERWAFTHLGGERTPAGLVLTARHNGSLIVARKTADALPDVGSWLGTATNRPAIAVGGGDRVEVWNTLMGKPDLHVTRFAFARKPDGPQTVVLPEAADERGFVAALGRESDTIVVVAEKTAGKRTFLVRRFDALGQLLGTLALGGENETISEARALALPSGKVLFVWTSTEGGKARLKSAVGTCGALGAAPAPASASASASASAP